jgi:hypothetical protein
MSVVGILQDETDPMVSVMKVRGAAQCAWGTARHQGNVRAAGASSAHAGHQQRRAVHAAVEFGRISNWEQRHWSARQPCGVSILCGAAAAHASRVCICA